MTAGHLLEPDPSTWLPEATIRMVITPSRKIKTPGDGMVAQCSRMSGNGDSSCRNADGGPRMMPTSHVRGREAPVVDAHGTPRPDPTSADHILDKLPTPKGQRVFAVLDDTRDRHHAGPGGSTAQADPPRAGPTARSGQQRRTMSRGMSRRQGALVGLLAVLAPSVSVRHRTAPPATWGCRWAPAACRRPAPCSRSPRG